MSGTRPQSVVQRFSDEYIERCRELSPQDIVRFLEDYRILFGAATPDPRRDNRLVPAGGEISAEPG